MTANRSRSCPGGCGRAVPPGQYACSSCWRDLPPSTRRRVTSSWREVKQRCGPGIDADLDPLRAMASAPPDVVRAYIDATKEAGLLLGARLGLQ